MLSKRFFYLSALFVFILGSCAQERSLTGGDQDKEGPQVGLSVPSNYSTNFNSETVYFEFDEYFQLNDISNQLIVSPPLGKAPQFRIKKKSLTMTLSEPLKENTTYTFNFGEGIIDYAEGNPIDDFQYVFSTGPVLDSLSIKGKVKRAQDNEPMKNVRVMLYLGEDDSLPILSRPDFVSKTKEDGSFEISNLAEGDYKIFALDDLNNDYLWDEGESIAFHDDRVQSGAPLIGDSILPTELTLDLSLEEVNEQSIQFDEIDSIGGLKLVFAKKPKKLEFDVLDSDEDQFLMTESNETDTVYFRSTNSFLKNTDFRVEIKDEDLVLDTLYLQTYDEASNKFKFQIPSFSSLDHLDDISIEFNQVVNSVDTSLIHLSKDSIRLNYEYELDSVGLNLLLQGDWLPGSNYELSLNQGAFKSFHGFSSDSTLINLKMNSETYYGSINLLIEGWDSIPNPILFLESEKGGVEKKIAIDSREIEIQRLKPEIYKFYILSDSNNNGSWDPSKYLEGVKPEKKYFFPEAVKIRSNWVLDYSWIIKP